MNLRECFDIYSLDGVQIRSSENGLELVCFVNESLTDQAYDDIREGVEELLDDPEFIDGDYDYMAGTFDLEGDTIVFNATQTRELVCTKEFRTPVLT